MNENFIKELIQRLKNRIADLIGAVTELELMVEVKNAEIASLNERLNALENETTKD